MDTTRRQLLQGTLALPALVACPPGRAAVGLPPLMSRRELGLEPDLVYLNTASAGPTPKRVLARTIEAWQRLETEPVYMSYSAAADSVVSAADRVRGKVATLLGCTADEILLTTSTTQGITTLANSIRLKEGDRVLLTDQEHEGGEVGWQHRERRDGIVVDRVNIPIGDSDPGAIIARFAAAIGPRTRVICFSHVLSPTGLRMPVAEIAALAKSRGVLCIVDGAQAVGATAVDVRALDCDAYAASGHKWLMGPKGTGFVFISERATAEIQPPQWFNERKFGANSAGLGPITLCIGLGQAIDDILAIGVGRIEAHNLALRQKFYASLADVPSLRLVSPPPGPLATALVAAALPPEIDSKLMRMRMHDRHRIVLKMAEKRWFNGIRFSPHLFNVEGDVDLAMAALRVELKDWIA
jgi:selenocysteine lyase/cysteine desulfurase